MHINGCLVYVKIRLLYNYVIIWVSENLNRNLLLVPLASSSLILSLSYPDESKGFTGIGLLSLRLSVSQDVSIGEFLLAPACPIEKVTLYGWASFVYHSDPKAKRALRKLFSKLARYPGQVRYPIKVLFYLMPLINITQTQCSRRL